MVQGSHSRKRTKKEQWQQQYVCMCGTLQDMNMMNLIDKYHRRHACFYNRPWSLGKGGAS